MNLCLETLLCSHETNPFVVQLCEPISLIVLPRKLLACSKHPSLPRSDPDTYAITILWTLRPIVANGNILFLAHHASDACNHHTMDSSPISSRRELNQFHAHHASLHQAHPRPLLDLVLQAQTQMYVNLVLQVHGSPQQQKKSQQWIRPVQPKHRQAKLVPDRLATSSTARRQAPNRNCAAPSPPSGTPPAARRHLRLVATTSILGTYRLAARPAPPGAIPVTQCYWFLAFLSSLKRPQTCKASFTHQS
ncbi:hypothetical protein DEO72_LG1g2648 [Vigna unguiculata]|uniref:Uncharacterized protein n=1 Tax=Vigna unguiculata TaxID=3917 RepID=A0A4D6KWY1_VIGUN|nr:hypothetical protein DEO72_LG1g2648 [Vigna unguiculata]